MWCLATCGESDRLRHKWGYLYEGYFTSHRHGCVRLCWLCTADDVVKGRHLQCPSTNFDHARHMFAHWCVGGWQQFDDYLCHGRTILGRGRWYCWTVKWVGEYGSPSLPILLGPHRKPDAFIWSHFLPLQVQRRAGEGWGEKTTASLGGPTSIVLVLYWKALWILFVGCDPLSKYDKWFMYLRICWQAQWAFLLWGRTWAAWTIWQCSVVFSFVPVK